MNTLATLALKGALGGAFVVVFALISEGVKPKTFAGLFGAAPSIALAALIVTDVGKGAAAAQSQSVAMVVGGVALAAYCVGAAVAVDRFGALRGSALALTAWVGIAAAGYGLFLSR